MLGHSPSAARWFDQTVAAPADSVNSSRLLRTEMTRALRRLGEPVQRRWAVLDHIGTIPLDHAVLQDAEAIVPHLKTLDAIHVATALRSGIDDLVMCTHDEAMKRVAGLLGLATHDPVVEDPGPTATASG